MVLVLVTVAQIGKMRVGVHEFAVLVPMHVRVLIMDVLPATVRREACSRKDHPGNQRRGDGFDVEQQ